MVPGIVERLEWMVAGRLKERRGWLGKQEAKARRTEGGC